SGERVFSCYAHREEATTLAERVKEANQGRRILRNMIRCLTSPRHVVDLVDLPGKKNIQTTRMVEEVQATHEVVRANITEANANISKTFNVSNLYEFHSEDVNEDKHSRTSSSKERENDEDVINKLAEEYMDHIDRGKRKNGITGGRSNVTPNK
ncbi:hypothetical protein Tco_0982623, partial [Tanacetum coccineum]